MTHDLTLAPHLQPLLAELRALEPLYHAAAPEASPAHFANVVAPTFWEVGASGRRYSRAFVLRVLAQRGATPDEATWQTDEFHVAEAGPDHALLTYRLRQPGRVTRRMTLWRRGPSGWQALYHQGTVVADAAS